MNYNQLNGHNRIEFMAKGSLGKNRFIFLFQRVIVYLRQIFMNCHHCSSFAFTFRSLLPSLVKLCSDSDSLVSRLVERRLAPRRGFRGECCLKTTLHRLCRQWHGKLDACGRCWQVVNSLRNTKHRQLREVWR